MDVNASNEEPPAQGWLRRQPVQARSEARIGQILDTVASIIAECGLEQVTTTLVASRSCMSVGALYRYFPDRQGLILALARRNLDRYQACLDRALSSAAVRGWADVVDRSIDAYLTMHATEPGFTRLRFGWGVDKPSCNAASDEVLAGRLASLLVGRFGLPAGPELVFYLRIATDITDVLLARAFAAEPGGDQREIDTCREVVRDYLGHHLPPAGDPARS